MTRGHVVVEGHGEVAAVGNLLGRLSADSGRLWSPPVRRKNLHHRTGIEVAADHARSLQGVGALLVLRDADDECPRSSAPTCARWLRELRLPFPAAVVLFKPEYEVLFLPCVGALAGREIVEGEIRRPGLRVDARWEDGSAWESRRGVKEWLSKHWDAGKSYKPTTDQLALTRMVDFAVVRRADVPCFGTLERALAHLHANWGAAGSGSVYPPPADG